MVFELAELLDGLSDLYEGDDEMPTVEELTPYLGVFESGYVACCEPDEETWLDADDAESHWHPHFERLAVKLTGMTYVRIEDCWE